MKKALISPIQSVETALGHFPMVVDVSDAEFPVAPPLAWKDCPDEVEAGWGDDGTSFLPPKEPEITPEPTEAELLQQWRDRFEVSRFQARAALHIAGLLAGIEAYMADPETDALVKLAWQDAQVFRRMSPSVLALQPMLSMTDAQLDDFFLFAGTITA